MAATAGEDAGASAEVEGHGDRVAEALFGVRVQVQDTPVEGLVQQKIVLEPLQLDRSSFALWPLYQFHRLLADSGLASD